MANANISLYSSGVIAGLETKLLTRDKIKALADAETFEDSVKILYETGFGQAKSAEDLKNFDGALQREYAKSFADFTRLSSDDAASEAVLLPYDYHNLKTLLKARATGTPVGSLGAHLYKGTLTDVNRMQMELFEGGGSLRPHMRKAIEKIGAGAGPQTIDIIVDVEMYEDIATLLERVRSQAVVNYYRAVFDYVNISTVIRNKISDTKDFSAQIIKGGKLSQTFLADASKGTLEDFFRALKGTGYKSAAEVAEESLKKFGNLLEYEKYYKTLLFKQIRDERWDILSINPLLSYFLAKKTELDNVMLILTCKKNKVDKKLIYQRLREVYA